MKVPNIRFNLKFYTADGNEIAIRTLADLAENLNLSDLWDYFASGDLERWLRSIGEQKKAEEVYALGESRRTVLEGLRELCRVLGLGVSEESLERFASMQERRRDKERDAEGAIESEREEVEYLSCLQRVLDNRCDLRAMRKVVAELLDKHLESFRRDAKNFRDIPLLCVAVQEKIGEVRSRLMGLGLVCNGVDVSGSGSNYVSTVQINGALVIFKGFEGQGLLTGVRAVIGDMPSALARVVALVPGMFGVKSPGLLSLVVDERYK